MPSPPNKYPHGKKGLTRQQRRFQKSLKPRAKTGAPGERLPPLAHSVPPSKQRAAANSVQCNPNDIDKTTHPTVAPQDKTFDSQNTKCFGHNFGYGRKPWAFTSVNTGDSVPAILESREVEIPSRGCQCIGPSRGFPHHKDSIPTLTMFDGNEAELLRYAKQAIHCSGHSSRTKEACRAIIVEHDSRSFLDTDEHLIWADKFLSQPSPISEEPSRARAQSSIVPSDFYTRTDQMYGTGILGLSSRPERHVPENGPLSGRFSFVAPNAEPLQAARPVLTGRSGNRQNPEDASKLSTPTKMVKKVAKSTPPKQVEIVDLTIITPEKPNPNATSHSPASSSPSSRRSHCMNEGSYISKKRKGYGENVELAKERPAIPDFGNEHLAGKMDKILTIMENWTSAFNAGILAKDHGAPAMRQGLDYGGNDTARQYATVGPLQAQPVRPAVAGGSTNQATLGAVPRKDQPVTANLTIDAGTQALVSGSKRKSTSEQKREKPELPRVVPDEGPLPRRKLAMICKYTNAYERHCAAPYAFNWHGTLLAPYKRVLTKTHKNGDLYLTAEDISRVSR